MSIGRIYKEYIQERIIKGFLTQGITPTKVEIDEELEKVVEANPSLQSPFLTLYDYEIAEREMSSAKKVNGMIGALYDDLSVSYRALVDQASSVTETYDSIISELSAVEKVIADLEERSANLLILATDSEGSLDFVSDTFKDKSKSDIINSTVAVDNTSRQVTLAPDTQSRIPMTLAESDIQFSVITRTDFVSSALAPGSSLLNAFNDKENIWSQRVEMRRGVGSVTAELIVRMPRASTEVSKIIIYPGASGEGNIATVTLQYSNDGLNWFSVDGQGTARLNRTIALSFSSTSASYWKFIFNKAGYDEYLGDSYIYEYGVKSIQFYGVEYGLDTNQLNGTFYSKALSPSSGKDFNRVSLSVCEVVPNNTDIQYSIAALTETDLLAYTSGAVAVQDLPFIDIDPLEREEKNNQTVIDFSKLDNQIGHSSSYMVDTLLDFKYKNNANALIDYLIAPSVIKEEIMVLRNVGDNEDSNASPSPVQVKNVDNGWGFDGRDYYCSLYIEEDSGITLDFGSTSAFVDGVRVTGQINIPQGYHSFRTSKENWRTINPNDIPVSLETPDPLYPYNHKYMIEGIRSFLYGVDLSDLFMGEPRGELIDPDQVYQGVSLYWESTLEEVTDFDYVNNIAASNYNIYAIVRDSLGNERIAVKHSLQPGLLEFEKFAIITRSVNGDLFKAVVLRANLNSLDSKVTPILDEYIIKLGY